MGSVVDAGFNTHWRAENHVFEAGNGEGWKGPLTAIPLVVCRAHSSADAILTLLENL